MYRPLYDVSNRCELLGGDKEGTVFLTILTLLLDLTVSYPLYSALTLSTLTIFYFLRCRRCVIRFLRTSVASVGSLVIDDPIVESRERGKVMSPCIYGMKSYTKNHRP